MSGNGKPQNTGLIRGVIKKCGLYIYPIGLVLIPTSTLNTTPSNLGKGRYSCLVPPSLALLSHFILVRKEDRKR